MELKTAVAIIIFNRPDTTKEVFEAIRKAKPPKLYIISDEAREGRAGEREKVDETRALVENGVDWECEVIKNYAPKNMGCKKRVASGISWVFEQEEQAIILEDDCVPKPEFFEYCQEMLEKYKDNENIMMVSGTNNVPSYTVPQSICFSRFPCIWGWATWRRAWNLYDIEMKDWPVLHEKGQFRPYFNGIEYKVFARDASRIHAGLVDTWDMQWQVCILKNGVGVVPQGNLIHNIGCGHEEATHTKDNSKEIAEYGSISFPIKAPERIEADTAYDKAYTKTIYGMKRVVNGAVHKVLG